MKLAMRHPGSVSRMLGTCKCDTEIAFIRNELAKVLDESGKNAQK